MTRISSLEPHNHTPSQVEPQLPTPNSMTLPNSMPTLIYTLTYPPPPTVPDSNTSPSTPSPPHILQPNQAIRKIQHKRRSPYAFCKPLDTAHEPCNIPLSSLIPFHGCILHVHLTHHSSLRLNQEDGTPIDLYSPQDVLHAHLAWKYISPLQ